MNNTDTATGYGHKSYHVKKTDAHTGTECGCTHQLDFIEMDVGALLNIADQLGAFKSWFQKNTDLTDGTYARRLNEVARLFDICSTYHHERGDYDTGSIYGRNAEHMRDLSHGLRHGGQMRETVIVNLDNMITGVKTTIDSICD